MQALDERPRGRGAALTFTLAAPIRCLCCATVSVPMAMRAAAFSLPAAKVLALGGGERQVKCVCDPKKHSSAPYLTFFDRFFCAKSSLYDFVTVFTYSKAEFLNSKKKV